MLCNDGIIGYNFLATKYAYRIRIRLREIIINLFSNAIACKICGMYENDLTKFCWSICCLLFILLFVQCESQNVGLAMLLSKLGNVSFSVSVVMVHKEILCGLK